MLVMGEVRTGLVQNHGEIPESLCREILSLLPGERVRVARRPIPHAISPELLTGVDCRLATASGARSRGVGTVAARATITAGRVLQGSAYTMVVRGTADHRLPWSHYLARPGVIEVLGKLKQEDIRDGYTAQDPPSDCLDLGGISGRIMDVVQGSPRLDRRMPFRMARVRLRWVAETGTGRAIHFTDTGGHTRLLRLGLAGEFTPQVVDLCEDLARHDWLLSALTNLVDLARIGNAPRADVTRRLAPAVDQLLHLWMPGVHVDPSLEEYWASLERRPGFSLQWRSLVDRIRDQLALNTLTLLNEAAGR